MPSPRIPTLSPRFAEIKRLRTIGNHAAAVSMIQSSTPVGDEDALEAIICLFDAENFEVALRGCQSYAWKNVWTRQTALALAGVIQRDNPAQALANAKSALGAAQATCDTAAIFLMLLNIQGLTHDAITYIRSNIADAPAKEIFLLYEMAESEIAAGNWQQAYQLATSVLSANPGHFRALICASIATFNANNTHEALGNALRANQIRKGSPAAVLQRMRCHNALGDHYSALAAFGDLGSNAEIPTDIHVELGNACAALENNERAIIAYEKALATGQSVEALRGLATLYVSICASDALGALVKRHPGEFNNDIECAYELALDHLQRRDIEGSRSLLVRTFKLAKARGTALNELSWPVPEPHIRHEYEQLELLSRRGKLAGSGIAALQTLEACHDAGANSSNTYAPAGQSGQALRDALTGIHFYPDVPFAEKALGDNDYAALEREFATKKPAVLVIDNFLSPAALAALRQYCEEATIWRAYNEGGYVAAMLSAGFNPRVLLSIIDELKQSLPNVIGAHPLLQAWAFKYDHRLRGTHVHADFAKVNVNFWITPDEACADNTRGGLIVYDRAAPKSWTFADYNADPGKMTAFIDVHNLQSIRIPYRANRCVLFDSRLFHATDDIRFKPGYTNRRINVTLLYGKGSAVE